MPRGFFLVFEGIDKCGKSTQAKLLGRYLKQRGLAPLLTREPGGTRLGEGIRKMLLKTQAPVCPQAELFLYEASRAQHVQEKILPALKAGRFVISDRFALATLAYQGLGRGLPLGDVRYLNKMATSGQRPDLTIVFDIAVNEAWRRMGAKRDRMEQEVSFLRKARNAYLRLAKTEQQTLVIAARGTPKEIHDKILEIPQLKRCLQKF